MKNILIRAITGVVYVAVVLSGIFGGPYAFAGLFAVITALCLWEFYGLVDKIENVDVCRFFNVAGGVYFFLAAFLFSYKGVNFFIFLPYFGYVMLIFILELYRKKENPLLNLAYSFLGQIYIVLPITLLNRVAFLPSGQEIMYNPHLILVSLFVFIWANDTGAYLIGVTFGKNRLFERISPKKSWEGFFGGMAFAILASLVFFHFCNGMNCIQWIELAVLVVIFATFGDLTESLMKRTLNVKDSGKALPGHGGFLDRFDSMLFAIYALYFYAEVVLR